MADRSLVVKLEALVADYKRGMDEAATSTEKVGAAAKTTGEQVEQSTEQGRRSLRGFLQDNEQTFRAMERSGKWMTTRLTLPIVALGTAVATTGVSYNALEQRSRAALTTLLGSAEAATKQMQELREFTAGSPFPRQAWIEAQQQLIGFGMSARRVVPVLGAIQDALAATGGTAADIEGVVDVFARIQGQGRITGMELQRLGIRGIDAAGILAEAFGTTADVIRDEISKGAIDADTAIGALVDGMNERFGGAADNVKKTWDGATDRVKAAFRDLSSAIVEPFVSIEGGGAAVDWANKAADAIRVLERAFRDLSPAQQQAVVGLVAAVAAIGPVTWAVGRLGLGLRNGLTRLRAFASFMMSPWGIALTGAALALSVFMKRAADTSRAVDSLRDNLGGAAADFDTLSDEMLVAHLKSEGVLAAWNDLGMSMDDLRSALTGSDEDFKRLNDAAWETVSWTQDFGDAAHGLTFGLVGSRNETIHLTEVLESLREATGKYNREIEAENELLGTNATATEGATGPTEDLAGAYGELAGGIEEATSALETYLDAQRAAVDPVFALDQAIQKVEDATANYNDILKDSKATQQDADRAAMDLARAIADAEHAALDGELSFAAFEDQLDAWVRSGIMTADQAKRTRDRVADLRGEADSFRGSYKAEFLANTADADRKFVELGLALDKATRDRSVTVRLSVMARDADRAMLNAARRGAISLQARAHGGPVLPGQPYLVGEEGPELAVFDRPGTIIPAGQTALLMQRQVPHAAVASTWGGTVQDNSPIDITLDLGEGIRQRYRIERTREGRTAAIALGAA